MLPATDSSGMAGVFDATLGNADAAEGAADWVNTREVVSFGLVMAMGGVSFSSLFLLRSSTKIDEREGTFLKQSSILLFDGVPPCPSSSCPDEESEEKERSCLVAKGRESNGRWFLFEASSSLCGMADKG